MYKYLFLSLLCIALLNACDRDDNIMSEVKIIVSSEMVRGIEPIAGVEVDYIQIKEIGNDPGYWHNMRAIDGFDYEVGYEYILLVKKTKIKKPLQDQANVQYEFIKIISKTWKG